MRGSWRLLALLVGLHQPVASASAQYDMETVLQEFKGIQESVVRIRTVADLEFARRDEETGERNMASRPYSVDGSGVVIGQMLVGDRMEYLILTNHHVADASNYVMEEHGYLRVNPLNTLAVPRVEEESYLTRRGFRDIRLIEVVRAVRGDMTLMRTDGADRSLVAFEGMIGNFRGEITPGNPIVISGFPLGREQVVGVGEIVATEFTHELGITHEDILLDMAVLPGQSGGPIFLIEADPSHASGVSLRLIGLVHAKDRVRSYGVPYDLWQDSLADFPEELQDRLVRNSELATTHD